jgi:hypothetical protein
MRIISILSVVGLALSGCVRDPSMWRPEEHISVARNCRVVCHKTGVKRYDALDGSCTCRDRK